MSEHFLQYQISNYLKIKRIMHFQTDVMSGLQYFSHKDPRRFAYINHHKKGGYLVGQPDLVLIIKNEVIFVELKTKTGKQSKEQKEFEKQVDELGVKYLIWRDLQDAMNFIEKK